MWSRAMYIGQNLRKNVGQMRPRAGSGTDAGAGVRPSINLSRLFLNPPNSGVCFKVSFLALPVFFSLAFDECPQPLAESDLHARPPEMQSRGAADRDAPTEKGMKLRAGAAEGNLSRRDKQARRSGALSAPGTRTSLHARGEYTYEHIENDLLEMLILTAAEVADSHASDVLTPPM
eukprot:712236-Hanusia_phi.AAC.5